MTDTQILKRLLTDLEICERYRDLVDKKWVDGLTPEESEEMESLSKQIDEFPRDKEFYDRVRQTLRKVEPR